MTPLRSRVAQVCALLNAQEARYLVVGATAMQLCPMLMCSHRAWNLHWAEADTRTVSTHEPRVA